MARRRATSATQEAPNPLHAVKHESIINIVTESNLGAPHRRSVFLVHGRNDDARDAMTEFLQALDLIVISWTNAATTARQQVGHSPTTLEIVQAGICEAAGVVVLFTPDDQVRLHSALGGSSELVGQARPNVILEAGIALAIAAPKVQLVRRIDLQRLAAWMSWLRVAKCSPGHPHDSAARRNRFSLVLFISPVVNARSRSSLPAALIAPGSIARVNNSSLALFASMTLR